eukprot:scaffold36669_cov47-Attheya_sp.AAC.1
MERREIGSSCFTSSPQCQDTFVQLGLKGESHPCHMQPSVFISPVIHFTLMLSFWYMLDYIEVLSCLMAWCHTMFTPYYYCHVIQSLMHQDNRRQPPVTGVMLGHHILSQMIKLRVDDQESDSNIIGKRFPTYRLRELPTKRDWHNMVMECSRSLLLNHKNFPSAPTNKPSRSKVYSTLLNAIVKHVPDAGHLHGHHIMAVLSIMGMCPLWYYYECPINAKPRAIQFLIDNYDVPKGKGSSSILLASLCEALKKAYGRFVCVREGENIVCKVYRMRPGSTSDKTYCDIVYEGQCIFEVTEECIIIHFSATHKIKHHGQLLTNWACDGKMMSMSELLDQFDFDAVDFGYPTKLGKINKYMLPTWANEYFPHPFFPK